MINFFEIKDLLKKDYILILPTDTVFAFICNAHSKKAIDNLFDLKKRERQKSFAIFCSKSKIQDYAYIDFEWQKQIIEKFVPGDVTLLLKCKDQRLKDFGVTQNQKIGIRIPKLQFWIDLLDFIDFPLVATSVNFSGEKSALSFASIDIEILKNPCMISKNYFSENMIFSSNIPSAIFDLCFEKPEEIQCLRVGRVSKLEVISEK
jgi:L-threonylcarbamoyladenylate synthase